MSIRAFTESDVEGAALAWLEDLGYTILHGPEIAPGEPGAERAGYADVLLTERLRRAIETLNPTVPGEARAEALRKVLTPESPSLVGNNRALHRMLVDGVSAEYRRADRSIAGAQVRLVDFDHPDANDWVAVNQFTIVEGHHNRRPDIVIFLNGLPIAVIELKNATDPNATVWTAFNQLQTYKQQISSLFTFNEALVISDGLEARIGSLTSDRERFVPWRTVEGEALAPPTVPQLQVLLQGVVEKQRFLDLLRYFTVFEDDGSGLVIKKLAAYHQFHAVNAAVKETLRAATVQKADRLREGTGRYEAGQRPGGNPGDRRVGVIWHTQGSGKSLTMAFYAGRIILQPEMENPTIVVLTDRNDLDDQLFGTFSRCSDLLRQKPVQATDRAELRSVLQVASGGVIFTTVQKFQPDAKGDHHPLLSDRRNIIVIADEAHRSQYDFVDGFARHIRDALPNASFIGFTGTPIELTDKSTPAVFGNYISIYDIQRAVQDGATVPIYYESRLAKLALDERERPRLDAEFEEVTEGEEVDRKEALKSKWAALETVVGSDKRINLIANDLVEHFEHRQEALDGKAMIVCMSRRICVEMYNAITRLRPDWHHADDDKGAIKIVMTGSASDPQDWQDHIRSKGRRETIANRFKNPQDPLKLVIVRDMWLTGFDVPCLHTMYVDKPMKGHGLMQAIARVNRVFRDKPGGLIVDYLGLADQLRRALQTYTKSGGTGETAIDQEEAVALMKAKYEICAGLFHGFNWSAWVTGNPQDRVALLPSAQQHILVQDEGKARFVQAVSDLSKAFALAVPHDDALEIADDVAFFQAVRSVLIKTSASGQQARDDLDHAIRQIISRAISSDEVVDIFAAAGLKKPDISILSDDFLADVQAMPQKNLALELLRKLLNDEIKTRSRTHLVQSRSFAEMLERTIRTYQNRATTTAQVIEELIELAKEMRRSGDRIAQLGLTSDEVAFYEALEVNDSAVQVLGDDTLKAIARDLVQTVRRNATIDWTLRETVRAKLRVHVRRTLRRYGYPPDKQEKATQTVLEQAELLGEEWTGNGAVA